MGIQRSNRQSSGIVPIAIRNTTEETIPAYGVVAIGAVKEFGVFERDGSGVGAGRAIVPVRKPDAESIDGGNTSLFLIATDSPIPAGQVGYATASVPTWAKADTSLTKRGQEASPQTGSWELSKGPGFWQVIDAKTVGSSQYAFVGLSAVGAKIFITGPGGIPARVGTTLGEASCQRWMISGTNLEIATGDTELVLNLSTEAVGGSAYIQCILIDGRWVANWEQCE